jgi:hypothetical protein
VDLDVDHRPSDSPYIAGVWRSRSEREVDEMTAVAYARWDLVFWEMDGAKHISVSRGDIGRRFHTAASSASTRDRP